jgi:hypothetical protein
VEENIPLRKKSKLYNKIKLEGYGLSVIFQSAFRVHKTFIRRSIKENGNDQNVIKDDESGHQRLVYHGNGKTRKK